MNCPNCGATHTGVGTFCMSCGARLTPQAEAATSTSTPAVTQPAPAPAAYQPTPPQSVTATPTPARPTESTNGVREVTVRRLSAGSVFKVTFVIYALLIAIFGCLFVLLPGLMGSGLLSGIARDQLGYESGLGMLGGGIISTLIVYLLLIVLGAFGPAVMAAIAALIYNLAAGWVGGYRIELQE